jgi:hypothetical protein
MSKKNNKDMEVISVSMSDKRTQMAAVLSNKFIQELAISLCVSILFDKVCVKLHRLSVRVLDLRFNVKIFTNINVSIESTIIDRDVGNVL